MQELQKIKTLTEAKVILKMKLENIAEGYIEVGFYLKEIRNKKMYNEEGYEDIYDFAKDTFNISRTWAIRFMQINDQYSVGGNSPEIQEKYKGFGSGKLSEMLTLPDDIKESVPPSATVKDIRDAKAILRETESEKTTKEELCDVAQTVENTRADMDSEVSENWMKKTVETFFKEEKECFKEFYRFESSDSKNDIEDIEAEIMSIVAPSKFRMIRIEGANVMLLEKIIKVMIYQDATLEYNYIDFAKAFEEKFFQNFPELPQNEKEAFENAYGEPLEQEKQIKIKENNVDQEIKKEVKEEHALGRMKKEDFSEFVPAQIETEEKIEETEEKIEETEELEEAKEESVIDEAQGKTQKIKIRTILESGCVERIIQMLDYEVRCPERSWESWIEKKVTIRGI